MKSTYGVPPFRLVNRGFGEVVLAVQLAYVIPSLAFLLQAVTSGDNLPHEAAYFWLTGSLSAFLDNAPTYLVFFELAGGDAQALMIRDHLLPLVRDHGTRRYEGDPPRPHRGRLHRVIGEHIGQAAGLAVRPVYHDEPVTQRRRS